MTNEEAIEFLKNMIDREAIPELKSVSKSQALHEYRIEALQMAIKALKNEKKTHTCTSCRYFTAADVLYGRCDKKDAYDSFTRAKRQRACKFYQNKKGGEEDVKLE